jgi:hypothetical protein
VVMVSLLFTKKAYAGDESGDTHCYHNHTTCHDLDGDGWWSNCALYNPANDHVIAHWVAAQLCQTRHLTGA